MFIIERDPRSEYAESYRRLRTNIQYSSFDKEFKTILITSAQTKEGKSTICGNIALAFAQNQKKVLIIDSDFRLPFMHKMFKVSNKYGLSEVLLGIKKFNDVVINYSDNLDILTSGTMPPNPSELLGTKTLDNLLEELKKHYDLIFLDSSSIKLVSEPHLLSAKVDGTILVIKKNKTKTSDVKETKDLLEKAGATIIGCVLNYSGNLKDNDEKLLFFIRKLKKFIINKLRFFGNKVENN